MDIVNTVNDPIDADEKVLLPELKGLALTASQPSILVEQLSEESHKGRKKITERQPEIKVFQEGKQSS